MLDSKSEFHFHRRAAEEATNIRLWLKGEHLQPINLEWPILDGTIRQINVVFTYSLWIGKVDRARRCSRVLEAHRPAALS